MYNGIPVKFRIHNPAKFEEVSLRSVVSADMPSWLMIESEQHYRKMVSEASGSNAKLAQDFSDVLTSYNGLIFDEVEESNQDSGLPGPRPSFEQYAQRGPSDDSYLDNRNFAVVTRAGGRCTVQRGRGGGGRGGAAGRGRRLSISTVQQQLLSGVRQMKEVSDILQTRLSQLVHGSDSSADGRDARPSSPNQTANWFEIGKFLVHFVYHVLVGGFFDGINSMIQIWAVLVLISALIRIIQIPDAVPINTAIMSVASIGYFLSFMIFYRVNATFGPFIVILKEMTVKDLSKWLFLVVLFLSASGQAMFIILDDPMSFLKVFKWMLGDTEQVTEFTNGISVVIDKPAGVPGQPNRRFNVYTAFLFHSSNRPGFESHSRPQSALPGLRHCYFHRLRAAPRRRAHQRSGRHVRLHVRQGHGAVPGGVPAAARNDHPPAGARALLPARSVDIPPRLQV